MTLPFAEQRTCLVTVGDVMQWAIIPDIDGPDQQPSILTQVQTILDVSSEDPPRALVGLTNENIEPITNKLKNPAALASPTPLSILGRVWNFLLTICALNGEMQQMEHEESRKQQELEAENHRHAEGMKLLEVEANKARFPSATDPGPMPGPSPWGHGRSVDRTRLHKQGGGATSARTLAWANARSLGAISRVRSAWPTTAVGTSRRARTTSAATSPWPRERGRPRGRERNRGVVGYARSFQVHDEFENPLGVKDQTGGGVDPRQSVRRGAPGSQTSRQPVCPSDFVVPSLPVSGVHGCDGVDADVAGQSHDVHNSSDFVSVISSSASVPSAMNEQSVKLAFFAVIALKQVRTARRELYTSVNFGNISVVVRFSWYLLRT